MLINLVEVLSGEKCTAKYHREPEKDIHRLENITIAIEFLKKFIQLNVSSQDILSGNLKVILGLVWRLILTFQVEGESDEESKGMTSAQRNKAARQKLLKWCQDTTAGHAHVNITDFESSWYDGMAFCALIHAMDPSLIDYNALSPDNPKHNLALAFDLAEKHFDIPRLLDPDDILAPDALSRPDEQCFITYISAFPVAMLQRKLKHNEQEDLEKIRRAEEEARRQAELEAQKKIREAEEAARRAAEEEARRREAEADARRRAEEEERRRREERERREAEERIRQEAADKAARKLAKEEQRRAKEEEERKRIAEMDEAKRLAEEEARERAFEEERRRLEEENRKLKAHLLAVKGKLIGRLHVTVIQARGLRQKADAYCTLFCERQKERTKTVKKTKEPKWGADFEFYVSERDAALELTVFSRNWLFSDDFLGFVSLPVSELRDGEETSDWYALKARKKKDNSNRGEVKLKVLYKLEH
jgi:DNA segregation ATPase FtsK/SpoIIIE-like protein